MLYLSILIICPMLILDAKPLYSLINYVKNDCRSILGGILRKLWIYIRPFFNWKFLVSYSIPFMITNGWAWIGVFLFPYYKNWFTITSVSWMAFLWAPFTPEKLVTIPMAIWIHTLIFKRDKKTRAMLDVMYNQAKKDWNNVKAKLKREAIN